MKKEITGDIIGGKRSTLLAACGRGGSSSGGDSADGEQALNKLGYISAAWNDDYCKRLNDAIVEHGRNTALRLKH